MTLSRIHAHPEPAEWMSALRHFTETYPEAIQFFHWLAEIEHLKAHDVLDAMEKPQKFHPEWGEFEADPAPFGPEAA